MTTSTDSLTLRVAEAAPRDAGRGVVRLDPQDIDQLGAALGDVVLLTGQRTTVARLMPAYAEQRGKAMIQMDGIVRANAGAGLDDLVQVRKATVAAALAVTLSPLDGARPSGPAQARYLARLLDRIPVLVGDRVRVNLFGTRALSFSVDACEPAGPVLIGPNTQIRLAGGDRQRDQIALTYEDIGGLRRELRRIREMIELPLRYPEVFERLGIDPPKGVLLHGPPGCGKTLIARAVAQETSAHFLTINGPEIIDKYYGSSEANLRGVFEEARRKAPAIIFIDEIDAIAPKREEMSGDRQIERRVVAQLLTLMDGLESRGNVMVIAATNIPNTLDPALRRPGRFDRELAISVPDKDARREILEIHTRGMPLAEDVEMGRIAALTHGFVGADLEALSREAAMSALRRLMPEINFAEARIPYEKLVQLDVTMNDFVVAMNEVEPSAIREVFVEVPNVGWDDVGGLDDVKRQLIEAVEWPLRHAELFAATGMRAPRGVLLHGAPGTGKTLLARALAGESEANFIAVRGPQLLSMWVGESERGVREVFRKARQAAPCIIFFDEIDALVTRRGSDADSQVQERVVSQVLSEMDGLEELKGVTVIAATNRPDKIDPALLRPGRFDLVIEMPLPDSAARAEILGLHTRKATLAAEVDLAALADRLEGFTGADLEGLCRRAALAAIRAQLAGGASGTPQLLPAHFEAALAELALPLEGLAPRGKAKR